jgi:hypothetical protein
MRVALVATLALLAVPALAQDIVYTGCIRSADGTLYNVSEGIAPKAPCRARDKQISWNMAGQPGPEGPAGPSVPPPIGLYVNCDDPTHKSINELLATPAKSIDITISGTCDEGVFIDRDRVTLAAADPGNPPTLTHDGDTVVVHSARGVGLHSLKITGPGGYGVAIENSQVRLESCEIGKVGSGVGVGSLSVVEIVDSTIYDSATGIVVDGGSVLTVRGTQIDASTTGILAITSVLHVDSSTILDASSLGIGLVSAIATVASSEVSGSDEGLTLNSGSSVEIAASTFSRNRSVAIGGEGTIAVKLYGGVTVSDNPGGGIGLSNGASLAFRGTNTIARNGVGIGMFNSSFQAFSVGEMQVFENGAGISCTLTSGACMPSDITDSITGCGPMCPDQADQP